ncbi:LytTR family DNA-binding domain-containing protein (plasmid) [Paraclostridium ghonii]|uniref:LytR/AlgR family response regulator transcription factor n=1 Tax=Paraclostridium ghonii TaxID=29358 RepID=UPI00202CC884|nr:LytTR family DNA-binding domain-containing protein [Paeniclostridium ghonii]MCM0165521.1 LytTR family DNA-binding domain-containing protein [Paeniclostridium ghonii]
MYRIVICEDDKLQMENLKNMITNIFYEITNQIEILEFCSGKTLLENELEGIDIFFLDIQMDSLTGMDVAKKIRERNYSSKIIFITSLIDYIQDGYTVRAYRYLLKPIKLEELKNHILNCIQDITRERNNFIVVERRGYIDKILIDSITYIEVHKKNITIYTLNNFYCAKNSIEKLEKELGIYNFFRCHKSYLINIKYIDSISKNTIIINDEKIPISKHRISNLKKKLTYVLGATLC